MTIEDTICHLRSGNLVRITHIEPDNTLKGALRIKDDYKLYASPRLLPNGFLSADTLVTINGDRRHIPWLVAGNHFHEVIDAYYNKYGYGLSPKPFRIHANTRRVLILNS